MAITKLKMDVLYLHITYILQVNPYSKSLSNGQNIVSQTLASLLHIIHAMLFLNYYTPLIVYQIFDHDFICFS